MSGSVNGMVRSEDGQKFFTGGDDKVKIKGRIHCSKNSWNHKMFRNLNVSILVGKSMGLWWWCCYLCWFWSLWSNIKTGPITGQSIPGFCLTWWRHCNLEDMNSICIIKFLFFYYKKYLTNKNHKKYFNFINFKKCLKELRYRP